MATALVSNTTICSICRESLNTPKILPCGHTFCLCCIERCIADKRGTFPCPFCRQDVKIPDGGAEEFTTNLFAKNYQPPSIKQEKCPNHNQREVDYYCNNCNVGLCFRCISKQHKDHETLDIECDETRNKAIEKLQRSQNIIQNRIKHLEKTRSTLLESFEQLKSLCEDSCSKVLDLRNSCEQIITDINKNLDENRSKVEDREMEITSEINVLESYMESIISPSTETTLNILQTLHRLIEIEKLDDSKKDYNLCIQYLQWVGKDFSLDRHVDQLVISKPFYIPGSYQFIFNISDITNTYVEPGFTFRDVSRPVKDCYSKNKLRNNNLVWSCGVGRFGGNLCIGVKLSSDNNRNLNYYIIHNKISLLNFDDDSKTKTVTGSEPSGQWCPLYWNDINWSEFTDTNNGYLNANGQCVVQFDTTIETLTREELLKRL